MAGRKSKLTTTRALIVEGEDDRAFFETLCDRLALTEIQVLPIGGKTRLTENLCALTQDPGFPALRSLLIVRDADDNPTAAFQSVCASLASAGFTPPLASADWAEHPNPKSLLQPPLLLKLAVLIVPGPTETGALEEVALRTVATDRMLQPAARLVQTAQTTLSPAKDPKPPRLPPPAHRQGKATVHAFLSTFEHPDRRFGEASRAGVWDFDHPALDQIRRVLRQMTEDPS
jgi:hypothetical protein